MAPSKHTTIAIVVVYIENMNIKLQVEGVEIRHQLETLSPMQYTLLNRLIEIELLLQKGIISEALAEAHLKYGDYTEARNAMFIIAEANNK